MSTAATPPFQQSVSNLSNGTGLTQSVNSLAPVAAQSGDPTTWHGAQSYTDANIPETFPSTTVSHHMSGWELSSIALGSFIILGALFLVVSNLLHRKHPAQT